MLPTLAGKPYSTEAASEEMALEATTPTSSERKLSQWWEEMPELTFGLAGSDKTGSRFKTWSNVVLERTQETFSNSFVSGPATAFPERGVAQREMLRRVGLKDRARHEMHTLIDIFCWAGCYVQLNMGALACMELVRRRLQQYTEALRTGSTLPTGPVRNTSPAAVLLSTWCLWKCSSKNYERDQRHSQLAPALV